MEGSNAFPLEKSISQFLPLVVSESNSFEMLGWDPWHKGREIQFVFTQICNLQLGLHALHLYKRGGTELDARGVWRSAWRSSCNGNGGLGRISDLQSPIGNVLLLGPYSIGESEGSMSRPPASTSTILNHMPGPVDLGLVAAF